MASNEVFFPLELLDSILSFSDGPTLKEARLACKCLNQVASRYLYQELTLCPTTYSFEKFDKISQHPVYSHYVQTVTYSGDMLPEDSLCRDQPLSFKDWCRTLKFQCESEFMPASLQRKGPRIDLLSHYVAYLHYVQGQINLRKSGIAEQWLSKICNRLTKLEHLRYAADHVHGNPGSINEQAVFSDIVPQRQASLTDGKEYTVAFSAQQVFTLLSTFEAIGGRITALTICDINPTSLAMAMKKLPSLNETAQHLKYIKIQLSDPVRYPSNWEDFEIYEISPERDLVRFIEKASQLTTLILTPFGHDDVFAMERILKVFAKKTGLQHLELLRAASSESALCNALRNNAQSLRTLKLDCCNLMYSCYSDLLSLNDFEDFERKIKEEKSPSWVSVIKFIQSTLHLQHISLSTLHAAIPDEQWATHALEDCTHDQRLSLHGKDCLRARVERFILSGGECPFPSQDNYTDWDEHRKGDHSWHHYEEQYESELD